MKPTRPQRPPPRILARFVAVSWRDLALSIGPTVLLAAAAVWLAIRMIQPAPPSTLVISAGPPGSTYWNAAQKYKAILAKNGVTLDVESSEGSAQNLARLQNPNATVDVGFVQSGIGPKERDDHLASLGSIGYVPLAIMYRGPVVARLSDFNGKRLAIGAEGSGARELSLALLKMNGIEPGGTTRLLPTSGEDAAAALLDGKIDAAFLSGDSTQIPVMAKLFRTPGVHMYSFTQAEAYARRFPYLTAITLPMGVYDLGRNLPPEDLHTVAPTIELVARDTLHPALSDLLIEAAREVHGHATILQHAGEFPSPVTRGFPLSDDAARYYKSGKTFLYRRLPFWVASLVDRLLVVVVPLIVVLIPGLRLVPSLYGWRVRSRIYRWYGALIPLVRRADRDRTPRARRAYGRGACRAARRARRHRGSREPHEDAARVRRAVLRAARAHRLRARTARRARCRCARRRRASRGRCRAASGRRPSGDSRFRMNGRSAIIAACAYGP
ncbi:hypothetical protein FEP07_02202 [Burkholderia multivorans]|nr:hypothetical protein [Burkholderia multivorans]MDR9268948.1 hypothetical protein [Burkholderia multivorans]MDR9285786.1 hypothetical protein [Burkholderia multivorans]MDR9291541.1 hypothetical protein [Burkholderia multivorans]MDR9315032.1 hypothetical protein [Burkholderia multivorans]